MSLEGSSRREQRRRLVVSWSRSRAGGATAAKPAAALRKAAPYAPDALPERQPALATLLPTSLGGLSAATATILFVTALALGLSVAETMLQRPLIASNGRFVHTLSAVRASLDLRMPSAIASWLGQMLLVMAGVIAIIVRLMRRHRRDDFNGRFRAWGWLATLFIVAACAVEVPIGSIVGGLVADLTGVALGPGGIGWWILVSAAAVAGVSLWAVLPLHDRLGTGLWLSAAWLAWIAAAAAAWAGRSNTVVIAGMAAWSVGAALACIAMLTAARSVIREVRGEAGRKGSRPTADARREHRPAELPAREPEALDPTDTSFSYAVGSDTEFTDGSDDDHAMRHLSKAERKRLRKQARLQRAG